MMKTVCATAALFLALGAVACTSGEASSAGDSASAAKVGGSADLSRIDPCALLTKDEIVAQVELSQEQSQREALRKSGVVWDIATTPENQEMARVCNISWRGTVGSDVMSRGEFSVTVTTAQWFKAMVGSEKQVKPIPGLGDEAYFYGYAPWARVGDVAVRIDEFPDTEHAKGGLDLLRFAVGRLH